MNDHNAIRNPSELFDDGAAENTSCYPLPPLYHPPVATNQSATWHSIKREEERLSVNSSQKNRFLHKELASISLFLFLALFLYRNEPVSVTSTKKKKKIAVKRPYGLETSAHKSQGSKPKTQLSRQH